MAGLANEQKEVSPKFFYDERGSELFEEITRLSEYYPTRVERGLLEACAPEWVGRVRPALLVEFGAGSAQKSRILLDAMAAEGCGETFVPVDVSEDFLNETARALRAEYPDWTVVPEVADIGEPLELPAELPRPALFALLGGTIGNFEPAGARRLVRRIAGAMEAEDRFLLGIDLQPGPAKPVELLEAAYNDARGVTAEFNRNALNVLNARLGADFQPTRFAHRAFYSETDARIEMHLVAREDQQVTIPGGGVVRLREGESIRTEISCKYDRARLDMLLGSAGLELEDWREDAGARFALTLSRPVS